MTVIPARFRRKLHNVAFIVEAEPPRPGLLGLYQGRPLPRRSTADSFTLPDRITLFQGPPATGAGKVGTAIWVLGLFLLWGWGIARLYLVAFPVRRAAAEPTKDAAQGTSPTSAVPLRSTVTIPE